jgi:acyl-CoA reductase-like NAD-dependent aldehyde dehydrogenase
MTHTTSTTLDQNESIAVHNPFDGSVVGRVTYADKKQAISTITAAKEVFRSFSKTPSHVRAAILYRTSEGIAKRKEELAQLIAKEAGKPITYARVEVDRASFTFRSAAEACRHAREGVVMDMSAAPQSAGREGSYRRFPIGVVLAITPFNFPLNLVAHKVAPALAVGNTVVLKPAPQTPLTSFVLADILREAGLPDGVLSIVPCANEVAEQMVSHPDVAMVSFTGSDVVGWKVKSLAGKARVALELGGNGSVIVEEIRGRPALVKSLSTAAFNYAGQICISLQTLYVHQRHYESLLDDLVSAANAVVVGDPLDDQTLTGPMISGSAAEKVEGWIAQAIAKGARRLTGEFRSPNWITPTVLVDVPHDCDIYQHEAFAPVMIVEPYTDSKDVFDIINRSKYGLQAGLFTSDVSTIYRAYEELEVGGLIVNDTNAFRLDTMPYGGVKNSGIGREGVVFAMDEMSDLRVLIVQL